MAKVLIADDSGTLRKIVIRSLNAVGIQDVVEAGDGQEALDKFQQSPFDLVLTDWNMPRKNGLELVQAIRGLGSRVPIVMLTTECERARVLQALQTGVSDYMLKPFTSDALREKLNKFQLA